MATLRAQCRECGNTVTYHYNIGQVAQPKSDEHTPQCSNYLHPILAVASSPRVAPVTAAPLPMNGECTECNVWYGGHAKRCSQFPKKGNKACHTCLWYNGKHDPSCTTKGYINASAPAAPAPAPAPADALPELCCGGVCVRAVCEFHSPEAMAKHAVKQAVYDVNQVELKLGGYILKSSIANVVVHGKVTF